MNHIVLKRYIRTFLLSHSIALSSSAQAVFGRLQSVSFVHHPRKSPHSCSLSLGFATMPRGVKKENLPSKMCVVCNRPFTWRKKWERCWDEVTTCSKSCNNKRRQERNKQKLMMKRQDIDDDGKVPIISRTNSSEESDDDFISTSSKKSQRKKQNVQNLKEGGEETNDELFIDIDASVQELDKLLLEDESQSSDKSVVEINNDDEIDDPVALRKAQRKAEKKRKKQERRAQREGRGDPTAGQKQCDMCGKSVDLLIRCTYDESLQWKMVCGKCWKVASGGVVDGDKSHPYYKYGGLWKNRRRK